MDVQKPPFWMLSIFEGTLYRVLIFGQEYEKMYPNDIILSISRLTK